MSTPICTIIAGPNGAGKTTFALRYLPNVARSPKFINADLIAAGLSPFSPESEWLAASRIFLEEIRDCMARREDFAFETTLSGRAHQRLIRELKKEGWQVELYYLWLPDVSMAVERVRERVLQGGHSIPEEVIRRRFARSIANFVREYEPLCDVTTCWDNSGAEPRRIYTRTFGSIDVHDSELFEKVTRKL